MPGVDKILFLCLNTEAKGKLNPIWMKGGQKWCNSKNHLKLLFYLLYPNKIPKLIMSSTFLFGDKIEIWRIINDEADCRDLQFDLYKLLRCTRIWGLKTNYRRNVVMDIVLVKAH